MASDVKNETLEHANTGNTYMTVHVHVHAHVNMYDTFQAVFSNCTSLLTKSATEKNNAI